MNAINPHCWICLEEGPNDAGEPLLNDCCACRGSAGYVHSTCLINYAKAKTREAVESRDIINLMRIWLKCPNCKQKWTGTRNVLDLMGKTCSAFVADEFSEYHVLQITALHTKLFGMDDDNLMDRNRVAKELLKKINECYGGYSQHKPEIILDIESRTYTSLGSIALHKQNPRKALDAFLHSRNLLKEIGLADDCSDIMHIDAFIARVEVMLSDGCNKTSYEEFIRLNTKLYENAKKEDNLLDIIYYGLNIAHALFDFKKYDDAKQILLDLLPRSQQVYGEAHPTTKEIIYSLREFGMLQANCATANKIIHKVLLNWLMMLLFVLLAYIIRDYS